MNTQAKSRSVSQAYIHCIIHNLYAKAGLIEPNSDAKRYRLRAHSTRKYFRTQLGALGTIPIDYIEYMMGHVVSTYNDIEMKGIEFLRRKYVESKSCMRQKDKPDIYDMTEELLRGAGYTVNREPLNKAIAAPHRITCDPEQLE